MHFKTLRPETPRLDAFVELFITDVILNDGVKAVNCSEDDFYSNNLPKFIDKESSSVATVCVFGCTPEGNSVYAELIGYEPWIRVEVPDSWQDNDIELWRKKCAEKFGDFNIKREQLKKFYGYEENKNGETRKFNYLRCCFSTLKMAKSVLWAMQQKKWDFLYKISVSDKCTKWKTKCLNDLKITPSSWITLPVQSYKTKSPSTMERVSTCQYELFNSIYDIKECKRENIPPLLIASFDGEMYSQDGSFPNPLKGDKTIYLGLSVMKYGQDKIKKYIFGEGGIENPSKNECDFIYIECKNSKEIVENFRDCIASLDVDLITGWNTYGFDYVFLHEDYDSYFQPPHLRGSQSSNPSTQGIQKFNIHELYHELEKNTVAFDKWFQQKEYEFGVRKMFLLKKECKLIYGNKSSTHSLFEDDEEDAASISYLPLTFIENIRFSLLSTLKGEQEAFRIVSADIPTLQSDNEFFTRPTELEGRGMYLSRFANCKTEMFEKKMNSAAKGENIYCFWDMQGRINVDLMQVIKDDLQPEDNSLKSASKTYLHVEEEKIDLSAKEMFDLFKNGNSQDKFRIAEYCVRDCDIPLLIIKKLNYMPTWIELSRVSVTSVHDIINSGQQTRIINLISRFVMNEYALNVRKSGWPFTMQNNVEEESDYQGATVIEPIAGFYNKNCIITMDFESLYPSVIRFFNLCPSTLILDPCSLSPKHIEIHTINHGTFDKDYKFVNHIEGVIPRLLKYLIFARKSVKKLMSNEKDPFQAALLNGRQNGLKRVCNSVYGFFGVSELTGILPCKPIAAVTTLKGRAFIGATKTYVETMYKGCEVIYGDTDSVMIKCPETMTLEEATKFGESLSVEITEKLQTGQISGLGGAGSQTQSTKSLGDDARKIKDACSAMNLAFEKVYTPYLLLKKKRYAGMKYAGGKVTMEMKGIDCIRRDRPKLLREISLKILDALLKTQDIKKGKNELQIYLEDIVKEKLPLDSFILSKSIKATYVSENLPHVGAYKRMQARGEECPPVGARMHFIVKKGRMGDKLYDRTEHPSFIKSSKEIDFEYYLDSLFTPLQGLLAYVVEENEIKDMFQKQKEYLENLTQTSLKSLMTSNNTIEEEVYVSKPPPSKKTKKINTLLKYF